MDSEPSAEESSRWTTIYPSYLDKNLSGRGGRRVNKSIAIDVPRVEDIRLVCEKLKVPYVVEQHKCYPRDFMNPGRIRACFRHPAAESKSTTKCEFLREIAHLIPQLKSRQECAPAVVPSSSSKSNRKKKR